MQSSGRKAPPRTWLVVTPERTEKTGRLMEALGNSWPSSVIRTGWPPDNGETFVVWGQRFTAEEIVPAAVAQRRPFFHIDNGYWMSAKGHTFGYYRMTYRGLAPILLADVPKTPRRWLAGHGLAPWRARRAGRHILLAMPGPAYGAIMGLDMRAWSADIQNRLLRVTDRPIRLRFKDARRPISADLADAWALVTHSSNASVDAVRAGVPAFVEPTAPTAPLGNLDLCDIENPAMPDREHWWASLLAQQFTLDEMRIGVAHAHMMAVQRQVDDVLRSDALDGPR